MTDLNLIISPRPNLLIPHWGLGLQRLNFDGAQTLSITPANAILTEHIHTETLLHTALDEEYHASKRYRISENL